MSETNSFREMLLRLDSGQEEAQAEVFHRFAGRLRALARKRLDHRIQHLVEPDDVLQSAFRSFFLRRRDGQFQIESWDKLWNLIAVIAVRKCSRKNRHYRAGLRDVRRNVSATVLTGESVAPWEAPDREPTPDEAAAVVETIEGILSKEKERGRAILMYRLQNYTEQEIADEIGCSERTVRRVLARAKERLESVLDE